MQRIRRNVTENQMLVITIATGTLVMNVRNSGNHIRVPEETNGLQDVLGKNYKEILFSTVNYAEISHLYFNI